MNSSRLSVFPADHPLRRHPGCADDGACAVEAGVQWLADGGLGLVFAVSGAGLVVPGPCQPAFRDGLWQHTCCEVFIAEADGAYREFNFSPSGEWAAYRFSAYRERDPAFAPAAAPQIEMQAGIDTFRLTVRLAPNALPDARALRLGLSAVLETADGRKTYWALAHAASQPDFHRPESFVLILESDPS